jgi:DNA-binding response OmpR family regulator
MRGVRSGADAPPTSSRGTILIVDSDQRALTSLRQRLEADGHDVHTAATSEQGLASVRLNSPSLIVLDPLLDRSEGFDLCAAFRAETDASIIVLTSSNDEADKIIAFELGADDYVTKPFQTGELIARIRSLLRRKRSASASVRSRTVVIGDLEIEFARREVRVRGKRIELRPREYELLAFLMENPGHTFTREQLLSRIWGYRGQARTRTVDVHVDRLRRKIEDDMSSPTRIVTVRGVGYRFNG